MPDIPIARSDVVVDIARPGEKAAVEAAITLGNAARSTLGHLPFSAYFDAARSGTLLIASADGVVIGYALYALVRRRIRLTHLCVAEGARRRGVARRLIDAIRQRHPDYLGVRARCRRDYGLAPMWIDLGFMQLGERLGRGRNATILTDWWLDYGHTDLYTVDDDSVLVRAAIDMNIMSDWIDPKRTTYSESASLLADHLDDRLQLFRTAALDEEIDKIDGPLRSVCLQKALSLTQASRDPDRERQLRARLLVDAGQRFPGYPRTPQDEMDLMHVSTALAADLAVFVTMDTDLRRALGPEAGRQGMRILRPAEVIVRIDELSRAEAYRPVDLQSTSYTVRLLASHEDHLVQRLANTSSGERPKKLAAAVRRLSIEGGERTGVFGPDDVLVAYYGLRQQGTVLEVDTFRVTDGYLHDTLTRQLLFRLRHTARDQSASVLRINSKHIQQGVRSAAIADGFREHNDQLTAFVIDAVGNATALEFEAVKAARAADLPSPKTLRPAMPALPGFELEHNWWPAKLIDSELPSYLVSIQQAYSGELLGVPIGLLPRNDDLGLHREHVYYRRPGTQKLSYPARILWYMSQGGQLHPEDPGIIACSQLDAVHIGSPHELYSRFQHLGVWDLQQVVNAASRGEAQALRFTNTEIFTHKVTLPRFGSLATAREEAASAPFGPRRISSDLFAAVYLEGMAK